MMLEWKYMIFLGDETLKKKKADLQKKKQNKGHITLALVSHQDIFWNSVLT